MGKSNDIPPCESKAKNVLRKNKIKLQNALFGVEVFVAIKLQSVAKVVGTPKSGLA